MAYGSDGPAVTARLILAIAIALPAAMLVWVGGAGRPSDLDHLRIAAQFLAQGRNPYNLIGPGRAWAFNFPLLYPIPAVLLVAPIAWLSNQCADAVFMGVSIFALVWVVTRRRLDAPSLAVLGSFALLSTLGNVQWSALQIAAVALPTVGGFLLAAKPTIGLAYWMAYPSRRTGLIAAAVVVVTVAWWPWWPAAWLTTIQHQAHILAPVQIWSAGGPLLLLAAWKWRRADARLLLALACVPHSPSDYDLVALFLIVDTWGEGLALAALTWVLAAGHGQYDASRLTFPAWALECARWQVALAYLPCLLLILRRPNVGCTFDLADARRWLRRLREDRPVRALIPEY